MIIFTNRKIGLYGTGSKITSDEVEKVMGNSIEDKSDVTL